MDRASRPYYKAYPAESHRQPKPTTSAAQTSDQYPPQARYYFSDPPQVFVRLPTELFQEMDNLLQSIEESKRQQIHDSREMVRMANEMSVLLGQQAEDRRNGMSEILMSLERLKEEVRQERW